MATRLMLSGSEQRIWESCYAAAFARLFFDELADRRSGDKSADGTWNATMDDEDCMKAEDAARVADQAIRDLRRFHVHRGAPEAIDKEDPK